MKEKGNGFKESFTSWWKSLPVKAEEIPATKVVQGLLFILLAFLTTALVAYRGGKIPSFIRAGQIAPYDIKADRDYEIIDEEATGTFRAEALQTIKTTYTFDPYLGIGRAERIKTAFGEMRRLLKGYSREGENPPAFQNLTEDQLAELQSAWAGIVGVDIGPKDWKFLVEDSFSDDIAQKVRDVVVAVMGNPIIEDREDLMAEKGRGIVVRVLPLTGETQGSFEEDWDEEKMGTALTIEEMKTEVAKGRFLPESIRIDQYEDRMIVALVVALIQPNMVFDVQETEARRSTAMRDVKNAVISVQSGESIIRGGARYEPWHIKVLEGIRKEKSKRSLPLEMFGSFALIVTIYLVVYLFGKRYIRRFRPSHINMMFMGSLMLMMLLTLRVFLFLTANLYGTEGTDIPRIALTFAIPMAAGAMLVRYIINSETAALFAVVLSAFSGIVMGGNVYFTAFTLMSSFVAAVAISNSGRRASVLQAGVVTGAINAVIGVSIHLINAASVTEPLTIASFSWYILTAFVNGIGSAVFVLVAAPVAEMIFGYTTDIKLLELANLNHPLLRELIIRAPGTYHHSHLVGILAETAAESIGANPLLTRVGAYYHDIGKIKKPEYFAENVSEGVNIHESLSPHMSALIVGSHVKYGMELARMYKLPKVIIDMIPEHHGTKRIGFFFDKAREATDPSLQKIEEKDFRYPGPKPQSREAAILMLADGAEAAVRALKEKSPTRIQQVVEDIIDKSFTEGELNECEITLKDLTNIAKAFVHILTSIYHQRVEYPRQTLEREKDEISVFEEDGENRNNSLPFKKAS